MDFCECPECHRIYYLDETMKEIDYVSEHFRPRTKERFCKFCKDHIQRMFDLAERAMWRLTHPEAKDV